MTPRLELLDNSAFVISNTQLDEIKTCPRRFLYRYLYRRVKATPNAAAHGGKAFDSALNHRYAKLGSAPCDAATEAEMLALIDAAYEGVELPLEEYRTCARYKEVVQGYNAFYQEEPFEVLGVQVPFCVELGEVAVSYEFWRSQAAYLASQGTLIPDASATNRAGSLCGLCDGTDEHEHPCQKCTACGSVGLAENMPTHNCASQLFSRLTLRTSVRVLFHGLLDLFVRLPSTGQVLVIDTKTAKDWKRTSYSNSSQLKGYVWALQELARTNPEKGLPARVHGGLLNAVVIRPPYKSEAYASRANARARNEFLRPEIVLFTPERLEEWRLDTLAHVRTALGWVAEGHFPQNERVCPLHYGHPCAYLDVCECRADQRETMLASDMFMDYERGPLAALTGDEVTEEVSQ